MAVTHRRGPQNFLFILYIYKYKLEPVQKTNKYSLVLQVALLEAARSLQAGTNQPTNPDYSWLHLPPYCIVSTVNMHGMQYQDFRLSSFFNFSSLKELSTFFQQVVHLSLLAHSTIKTRPLKLSAD